MKIVAIVQARMGSVRLPGKVLADLAGAPMLVRVMDRLSRARRLHDAWIATSTKPEDDVIEALCREQGWSCFRGSEHDLLDRYHGAAIEARADVVVRVTSDCPLIDPTIADLVIDRFLAVRPDYASNTLSPRTYPRGLDVEVFTVDALRRAWTEDLDPAWREHVTPYLYRSGKFRVAGVAHGEDLSTFRWTADTPEDLDLVRRVYGAFGHDHFSWLEVLALMRSDPALAAINANVRQKEL